MRKHFTAKAPREDIVPWVRIADFRKLELPRPIVLVNGAFDLLHSGHLKILWHARKHSKILLVALDSDQKIKQHKGVERPLLTWVERATALSYLPVDYIVEIENDGDFVELVNTVEPDLRVLGAEYRGRRSRVDVKTMFVQGSGMHSSTLVERIVKRYGHTE